MRRIVLLVLALASSGTLAWQAYELATNPVVHWLAERPVHEIRQTLARELLFQVSPDQLNESLGEALAEKPADWPVIDGLLEYAEEQSVAIAPARQAEIAERRRQEQGWIAGGKECVQCALNSDDCQPSLAMACNLAVEMTPLGDLRSVQRAVIAFWEAQPIDYLDVGLATVGLAATAGAAVSAGTSYTVKVGSGILKAARKAGAISVKLSRRFGRLTDKLVDFRKLPQNWWRSPGSLAAVVDARRLRGLTDSMMDLGRISVRQGPRQALSILKSADSPSQLAALRRGSDAMGDRFPMAMKLLGKSRVISGASRWSRAAWEVAGAFAALVASLVALFWSALTSLGTRGLKWWLRRGL